MSRGLPLLHRRRIVVAGVIGGITCASVAVGAAMAGQDDSSGSGKASVKAASSITCPAVEGSLPEIPVEAKAEVDRNLALLDTQLAEANKRLSTSQGEGGPNFVQNAILGPLADKRKSTLDRIATSIGRRAEKPTGLDALAECTLSGGDAGAGSGAGAGGEPDGRRLRRGLGRPRGGVRCRHGRRCGHGRGRGQRAPARRSAARTSPVRSAMCRPPPRRRWTATSRCWTPSSARPTRDSRPPRARAARTSCRTRSWARWPTSAKSTIDRIKHLILPPGLDRPLRS